MSKKPFNMTNALISDLPLASCMHWFARLRYDQSIDMFVPVVTIDGADHNSHLAFEGHDIETSWPNVISLMEVAAGKPMIAKHEVRAKIADEIFGDFDFAHSGITIESHRLGYKTAKTGDIDDDLSRDISYILSGVDADDTPSNLVIHIVFHKNSCDVRDVFVLNLDSGNMLHPGLISAQDVAQMITQYLIDKVDSGDLSSDVASLSTIDEIAPSVLKTLCVFEQSTLALIACKLYAGHADIELAELFDEALGIVDASMRSGEFKNQYELYAQSCATSKG